MGLLSASARTYKILKGEECYIPSRSRVAYVLFFLSWSLFFGTYSLMHAAQPETWWASLINLTCFMLHTLMGAASLYEVLNWRQGNDPWDSMFFKHKGEYHGPGKRFAYRRVEEQKQYEEMKEILASMKRSMRITP